MIKKTLSFSSPGRLTTRYEQLVYDGEDGVHRTFPIEDIGFVVVETGRLSMSTAVLQKFAAANVAFVVCDGSHVPAAQLQPFAVHTTAQETVASQLAATDAVQGRIWRQIVRRKILNQAELASRLGHEKCAGRLGTLADEVKNHDVTNCEAQAARIYFQQMMKDAGVNRDPEGGWPNCALNYGYAILRAAVARALVGSGLLCLKGVHHHNRYNPFALADDVMEPYRPFVDQYVFGGEDPFNEYAEGLSTAMKASLLRMLTCDVMAGGVKRPLAIAVTFTTASLARYYLDHGSELVLPEFVR